MLKLSGGGRGLLFLAELNELPWDSAAAIRQGTVGHLGGGLCPTIGASGERRWSWEFALGRGSLSFDTPSRFLLPPCQTAWFLLTRNISRIGKVSPASNQKRGSWQNLPGGEGRAALGMEDVRKARFGESAREIG